MQNITLTTGRDYAYGYSASYEYCVFSGEKIVARKGGFKSNATARRNGIKAAQELAA